jgi:hypothetical protein
VGEGLVLGGDPELINTDPYGDGWTFVLASTAGALDTLMDAGAHAKYVAGTEQAGGGTLDARARESPTADTRAP